MPSDNLAWIVGDALRQANQAQRGTTILTHQGLPGRTRTEKRANAKAARRVLVEYRRITGHYPNG